MKFQGIIKRLMLASWFAVLGAGCEYTKIYEVAVPQDTTEDAAPPTTAPSAEGDEIIAPEPKEDEVAVSPEVPEAPRADEPPVFGGDEPAAPLAGDPPVIGGDAADLGGAAGGVSLGSVTIRGGTNVGLRRPEEDPADRRVTDIEMTFRTGEIRGSGTDAKVFAKFCPTADFDADARCNTFRIEPNPDQNNFEPGDRDVVTLATQANFHPQMTHTGGPGLGGMNSRDVQYLQVYLEANGSGPSWLLAGLQVRVKTEGSAGFKTTYLNPCVHRWINPDAAWNDAKFGPRDQAVAVVLTTSDVDSADTDDEVSVVFPKVGVLDPEAEDQRSRTSASGSRFQTEDESVTFLPAWEDYDDFERGSTASYCSYFFNDTGVQTQFRIEKVGDSRGGGWNLDRYKLWVFNPGQDRFLEQNRCHVSEGRPGWLKDDRLAFPSEDAFLDLQSVSGVGCEELKNIAGDNSIGLRIQPAAQAEGLHGTW